MNGLSQQHSSPGTERHSTTAQGGTDRSKQPTDSAVLWLLITAFCLLAGGSYYLVFSGSLEDFVLQVDADPHGFLWPFLLFYIVAVVLFFPTMLLQVLSGAMYSFLPGLLVSWVATSIGQAIAFLLGRHLLRQAVKAFLLERFPNFHKIELAIKRDGWKLMCLLRLSPILPYNVLNYAAALTPIPFMSFFLSSSLAILPWTCVYVYLGTLTSGVADILRGKVTYPVSRHHPYELYANVVYVMLITLTVVYGYHLSKRAIEAALKVEEEETRGLDPGAHSSGP